MSDKYVIRGYRIEFKPGEYLFYTVNDYKLAMDKKRLTGAKVYELVDNPLRAIDTRPVVYHNASFWIEPKYTEDGKCPETCEAFYLGNCINDPQPSPDVLSLFPSMKDNNE